MERRNFFKSLLGIGTVCASNSCVKGSDCDINNNEFVVGHGGVVVELVRNLGLDPTKTQSVHLNMDVGEAVTVETRQLVTQSELLKVAATFKQDYRLVKNTPAELIFNGDLNDPKENIEET